MIINHPVYNPLYTDRDKFVILITGGRGCESPDQGVMMADLTVRAIRDLRVGDRVMGEDFTPRTVLRTFSGRSEMYRVRQTNGDDYVVNDAHRLVLRGGDAGARGKWTLPDGSLSEVLPHAEYGRTVEMPVGEYVASPGALKSSLFGYRVGSVPYPFSPVSVDPYLLGMWLGGGVAAFPGEAAIVREALMKPGVSDARHIPQCYISNSEETRLSLLAGMLDAGGFTERGGYMLKLPDRTLAGEARYLAQTLGFTARFYTKGGEGAAGDGFCRLFIEGNFGRVPCRVQRKRLFQSGRQKDRRLSRLTVASVGVGEWCGIMVDGDHRYLHPDGTVMRNSGKSFAASTFIERLTFEKYPPEGLVHKVLYTRYTMTSANISIIPEMMEKVELDGTGKYFRHTREDVINNMTGGRILFRGIKSSSGNQTAKLKSIHGVTTFVCDEAEEFTSETDYEKIMLSIRQKGIQNRVIIIMNPTDSNHFVYRKYIKDTHRLVMYDGVPVQISTHPNVLHIHTSYLDNIDNLSEEFLREARWMKESDPARYAHVFMGQWSDVAEGAVFKKWGVVSEFPANAKKVALGLDLGYTNDVSACVKCGVMDNDLYLDEQFYRRGMLAQELIRELRERGLFVYSDSADPRLIQEIANGGVIIYPVAKPAGSIVAGIERMKMFDNIFVTSRSLNLQDELRNYVWARDKDGNAINYPEDHDNHAIDASRYFVNGSILGQIVRPRSYDRSSLPIF